jgi:hypothetical protein
MINNDSLTQAFDTLARSAPAEDEVLAGVRTGIARRRRRRQAASVVGVAVAAAAVALGVVYVTPGRGADQTGSVGAAPTTPVRTATPPAPPALPFTVGWIPDGYQLQTWEAGTTGGSAQYVGTKDFQTVVVWISAKPRDAAAKGDTEEPATIAGRPGVLRRLTPDSRETQLSWQLADGRWAMVGGRAPTVSLSTLQRVADSVAVEATPMPVPFSLTTLPDGYGSVTWMGGSGGPMLGSLSLCRSAVEPRAGALPADCVDVSVSNGTAPAVTLAKDGDKVSGMREIPIDQARTVGGVPTRATADGTMVVAQLDAGHWAQASSQQAGVDLLRQVVATVRP